MKEFLAQLKAYIEQQQQQDPDPYQSPRIRPFEGTVLEDPLSLEDAKAEEDLLSLSSEHSQDDAPIPSETPDHLTVYWQPEHCNIGMLPGETAQAISNLTGCILASDPSRDRFRIFNGETRRAQQKLKNLEKLLVRRRTLPLLSDADVIGTTCRAPVEADSEGGGKRAHDPATRR